MSSLSIDFFCILQGASEPHGIHAVYVQKVLVMQPHPAVTWLNGAPHGNALLRVTYLTTDCLASKKLHPCVYRQ